MANDHSKAMTQHKGSGNLLPEAISLSEDAVLLIDLIANKFIECNAATVRMLHAANKDEVLFTHPWELSPQHQPDGRLSEEKSAEMNATAEKNKFHRFEWMHRRLDGELFPVEVTLTLVQLGGQKLLYVVWRDLTEQKRAELSLARYNRALSMLSAGNRALFRSTDERQLLEAMCRIAVDTGGYRMVCVCYQSDGEPEAMQLVAHADLEGASQNAVPISWLIDGKSENQLTDLVITNGQTQVVKDIMSDMRTRPWQEEAAKLHYRSFIGLPLKIDGYAFGALMLFSGHVDAFDETELPLLEDLAEDLSYGISTLRNNQLRQEMELALEKSHSLLQAALESTADGVLVVTLSGEIENYNQLFVRMFGIPTKLLKPRLGVKVMEFIVQLAENPKECSENIRYTAQTPGTKHQYFIHLLDGRTIEHIIQPQHLHGRVIGQVNSFRDISEQNCHEQQLTYLATHDDLTGLPNRYLLNDRLEQGIAHARRTTAPLAVLYFDLDRFKLVNDSLGHSSGDLLLKFIAQRLPGCIREGDTVARMGGDEFVIILLDLAHDDDAALAAQKLLEIVSTPYAIAGRELFSSASIGIAYYPRDGQDAHSLLTRADAAMYLAKSQGGNCFQIAAGDNDDKAGRRLAIAHNLHYAFRHKEFEIYYQPQFNIQLGRITGAEALIRWHQPEMGMIPPDEFIPIAEETGLILDIGVWVVETVCSHIKAWHAASLPKTCVAVNLSIRQLDLDGLPKKLSSLLNKAGIETGLIELEITEGMVMKQPDRAIKILGELKTMGFMITVDDFGTGYSSLSYLKRFPVDKLKIDRSFLMDIPEDKDNAAIMRAVIAMAHELRLEVIAEGVETEAQLEFLKKCGCDVVQGYLVGSPMQEEGFAAVLKALK